MISDREEKIRRRAYELWEAEGRPEGKQGEHWERAAREIEAEESGTERSEGTEDTALPDDPSESAGGSGLSNGLQPGGTIPDASPATGEGSTGTGGGSTRGRSTGTAKRPKIAGSGKPAKE